jgi:hypothetical protein
MIKRLLEGDWDVDTTINYLFPYSMIVEATKRTIEPKGMKIAGLDVARYGKDQSVMIVKQGGTVLKIHEWSKQSTVDSAGIAARYIREDGVQLTYVDAIGIGAGVYDPLDRARDIEVIPINVGERALESDLYINQRAEYFNKLALLFQHEKIDIPNHDRLKSDLAKIKYMYDVKQRMQIESKEKLIRRGEASPDYADALMLAYCGGLCDGDEVEAGVGSYIPVKVFG